MTNKLLINDKNEYICPITQQIMRNPVIASDGITYEENAIKEWIRKQQISPITREPIQNSVFPNRLIEKQIEILEKNEPDIYMERYQYDLKEFLKYCVRKHNPKIDHSYELMLDEIPSDTMFYDSDDENFGIYTYTRIHQECNFGDCKKYKNNKCELGAIIQTIVKLDTLVEFINACKMPDRKILYKFLIDNCNSDDENNDVDATIKKVTQKIINSTSLNDEGLAYFISHMCDNMSEGKYIVSLIDILNPNTHYKLIPYSGFKSYIIEMKSLEQFTIFITEHIKHFDHSFYKYALHCLLSNYTLSFETIGEQFLELANSMFALNDLDPDGDSIITCLLRRIYRWDANINISIPKSDILMCEVLYDLINHKSGFKDGVAEIKTFINFSTSSSIWNDASILRLLLSILDTKLISENDMNEIISSFFYWSEKGLKLFFDWMISNNIQTIKKYIKFMGFWEQSIVYI